MPVKPISDRILFPGNPWPKGHQIKVFAWFAQLAADGQIWFHLHLKSDNYYAGDGPQNEDDDESDDLEGWEAKILWQNYHSCTLSSAAWNQRGFVVGSSTQPLDMANINGKTFTVDPLPFDLKSEPSFGIYCLGHDTVAGHQITFTKEAATWTIDWTAKIALTYGGEVSFDHELIARATGVAFDGIEVNEGVSSEQARGLIERSVTNASQFNLNQTESTLRFDWQPPQ